MEQIRLIVSPILQSNAVTLFQVAWDDVTWLQSAYQHLFIHNERQGRLEDSDSLPYTLDFLVLEELDFVRCMMKAPPVKYEFERQLKQAPDGPHNTGWLQNMISLVSAYAQITTEEAGMWDIDVNLFLSEETSVTANYTPRISCGELFVRGLAEWLKQVPLEALLVYCQSRFSGAS